MSQYMRLRFQIKSDEEKIENFAVMIREVPMSYTDDYLQEMFDTLFPDKVLSVIRAYDTADLDKKLEKRTVELRNMEQDYAVLLKKVDLLYFIVI